MSRFKAAGIHLLLSCVIALLVICVMVFVWYPPPLFELLGGVGLLVLIAGCDVVLGPLMTLVVFKSGKKGMKFDLWVIGLCQLAALAYGTYVMAEARPAYMVFVKDRFELVSVPDITQAEWDKAKGSVYESARWTGPEFVGAIPPEDIKGKGDVDLLNAMGLGVQNLPRYYVAYDRIVADVIRNARPIEELKKKHPEQQATIDKELEGLGFKESQVGYMGVNNSKGAVTALIQRDSGKVVKLIGLNPWTSDTASVKQQ